MGKDITMHIIDNNKILKEDIFDGRDYEWFDNLSKHNYYDPRYQCLNNHEGELPPSLSKEDYERFFDEDEWCKPYYFSVKEFLDWFCKYQPHKEAGWVRHYDKWLINECNYLPSKNEIKRFLEDNESQNRDWCFITFEVRDSSKWLFDYIFREKIPQDCYILYWFDW